MTRTSEDVTQVIPKLSQLTAEEYRDMARATLAEWNVPVSSVTVAAFLVGWDKGHEDGTEDAKIISDYLHSRAAANFSQ